MELKPGVVSIWGPRGSMKSSQAASFPGIVKIYDFDLGIQRAWGIEDRIADSSVDIKRMEMPTKSLSERWAKLDGFKQLWLDFIKDYDAACRNPDIKAILFDTNTINWQLIRDGYLEEKQNEQVANWLAKGNSPGTYPPDLRKQILQIEYGEPNQRMRILFHMASSAGKWLVLVHHETAEYVPLMMAGQPVIDQDTMQPKSVPTGKMVSDGWKYTEAACDWIFHTGLNMQPRDGGGMQVIPYAEVEKSALGIDLVGFKINLDVGEVEHTMFEKLEMYLRSIGRID